LLPAAVDSLDPVDDPDVFVFVFVADDAVLSDDPTPALVPVVSVEFHPSDVPVLLPPLATPGTPPPTFDPLFDPADVPSAVDALLVVEELDPLVEVLPALDPAAAEDDDPLFVPDVSVVDWPALLPRVSVNDVDALVPSVCDAEAVAVAPTVDDAVAEAD